MTQKEAQERIVRKLKMVVCHLDADLLRKTPKPMLVRVMKKVQQTAFIAKNSLS